MHLQNECTLRHYISSSDLLVRARHTREALLLKLCFGGFSLARSTQLRVSDVIEERPPGPAITDELFHLGASVDRCCNANGRNTTEQLLLQHLASLKEVKTTLGPDSSIFPSRKGGRPITPRTAERLLKQAWASACRKPMISFRTIGLLGRCQRSQTPAVEVELPELMQEMDKLDWLFKKLFARHPEAEEDARQEAALRVWALLRQPSRELSSEYVRSVATGVARSFYAKESRRRSVEVPGIDTSYFPDKPRMPEAVRDVELALRIKVAFRKLSYRERTILKFRYGLEDGYWYTRDEVAHIFKISPSRISQLEARAINKLRAVSTVSTLAGFLD